MIQVIVCFSFLTLHYVVALEPSLLDVTAIQCPPERPYICLPYGMCCGGDEFCHQGSCESCFPRHIADHDLLKWCQDQGHFNVTLMRHNSCGLACYARFNVSTIPRPEEINFSSDVPLVAAVAVLASVLTLVFVALIFCLIRRHQRRNKTRNQEEEPRVETLIENKINESNEGEVVQVINELEMVRNLTQQNNLRNIAQSNEMGVQLVNVIVDVNNEQTVPLMASTRM